MFLLQPSPWVMSVNGGAGAVFSIGLLKQLNLTLHESCVWGEEQVNGGPMGGAGEVRCRQGARRG